MVESIARNSVIRNITMWEEMKKTIIQATLVYRTVVGLTLLTDGEQPMLLLINKMVIHHLVITSSDCCLLIIL